MAKESKIEWCDHTFNPWEGCTKVSPGCAHCYAEARNARFGGGKAVNWGKGAPRRRTSAANWKQPLRWNRLVELGHFRSIWRDGKFIARGDLHRLVRAGLVEAGDKERFRERSEHSFDHDNHSWLVGKKAAGRGLDGRKWDQFPKVKEVPA